MHWKSRTLLTILALVLAGPLWAQQVKTFEVDLKRENRDFLVKAAAETEPTLRVYMRSNRRPYTSLWHQLQQC